MVKSAYIHIPFCKSKCHYCSFVSYSDLSNKDEYIEALIKEIKNSYKGEVLNTIYFGGGTPSVLPAKDFEAILEALNFNDETEITVEFNPGDVNLKYLKSLKKLGVNRISLGVQALDDDLLRLIGRRHSKKEVLESIDIIRQVGFNNVSIDLIYGLPSQTLSSFLQTLKQALNLNIEHISLYGLKIEEGCKFYYDKPKLLPDDDIQAQMYLDAVKLITDSAFNHYEISNFAKKGFESRHNLNYWNNSQYYGFGAAASGYESGIRYSNETEIKEYIKNPTKKLSSIELTEENKLEEEIFLGFRKLEGIDISVINKKFNIDFDEKYKSIIDKFTATGHIEKTGKGYKLTLEGILLSNNILSEFIV